MTGQGMKSLHEYGQELFHRLRLRTFPVAIKMLEKSEDIPDGSLRPKKDLGHQLAACQAFALSRREGMSLAMMKRDMWCSEAVIGYGLGDPPEYFLDGHTRYPQEVETLEVGSIWAHKFPRFEAGKYVGIACAPLGKTDFEPDVVLIYCDSAQLKMLTATVIWKHGCGVETTISNCGACVYAVVPAMQTGKCSIALPCGGDRAYAMCQDDEMIFTAPLAELENLVLGLRHLNAYNNRVPVPFVMRYEFPMRDSYIKVGKMLGMDLQSAQSLGDKKFV